MRLPLVCRWRCWAWDIYPAIVIGLVAGGMSLLGLALGNRLGETFGKRMEIVGGLILIGIGAGGDFAHALSRLWYNESGLNQQVQFSWGRIMRGLLAGLLVALIISAVALAAATLGAVGVAAIGWLLHRWFGLSQWQGTLVALTVAIGLGFLVYKLASQTSAPVSWEDDVEEWEDEEEEPEPPIVPWRRSRPTQGDLPNPKAKPGSQKPK